MRGYCVSYKYCQYKSDTGYCGYTGGCVQENATIKIPTEQCWFISKVVDISTDSIEEIADAVVKKLRGKERKTGKWMHDKDDVLYSGYCSCCGWESVIGETDVADMSYCPNCGADMRGDMVNINEDER